MIEKSIWTVHNFIRILGNLLCLFMVCFGGALAGLSAYILVTYEYIGETFGSHVFYGSMYAILACSILTVVTGLFGFYDFTHANRFTSILISVLLACLILAVPILGILLFLYPRTMKHFLSDAMVKSLPEYGQSNLITRAWDTMQYYLRCCAIDNLGWHAYNKTGWFQRVNRDYYEQNVLLPVTNPFYQFVPASCCVTIIDGLTGHSTNTFRDQTRCQHWQYGPPLYTHGPHNDALYYRGCFKVLVEYMQLHTKHLFGLSIGLEIVLIITFILLIVGKLTRPRVVSKRA